MPHRRLDANKIIYYLTLIIRSLCEENELNKYAVIKRFDLILKEGDEENA